MKLNRFWMMLKLMILTGFILLNSFQTVLALPENERNSDNSDNKSGFALLPILGYMPETKAVGGVLLNYYYREAGSSDTTRPSTIMPAFIYTQKKQISSEVSTDLYWKNETYHLNGYVSYQKFPDKFYGIGNNTSDENEEDYTPRLFQLRLNFQKKIVFDAYVGIKYYVLYNKLLEVEENGLLDNGNILGVEAGITSGFGISIQRDSRNNVFYPSSGTLLKMSVQLFNDAIGSDYDFTKYSFDVRRYLEPVASHVLAFQGYANVISGEPPFQMMSPLGDSGDPNLMRGYYQGRYRDNHLIVLQSEYRLPLWWRFGFAAFAGAGDVAHTIKKFNANSLKYSYGCGLRFQLDSKEKINIRLDFGFGENTSGIYLKIGEAF